MVSYSKAVRKETHGTHGSTLEHKVGRKLVAAESTVTDRLLYNTPSKILILCKKTSRLYIDYNEGVAE